jgi:hypothetical protein
MTNSLGNNGGSPLPGWWAFRYLWVRTGTGGLCLCVSAPTGLTAWGRVDMVVYGVIVPILPYIAIEKLHMDETALGFLFGSYGR